MLKKAKKENVEQEKEQQQHENKKTEAPGEKESKRGKITLELE